MKLNRLEAHDRLLHFKKDQEANVFLGAEECLKKNEDSLFYQDRSPYVYIFAHPRTADDGVTKRLLWQPRLLKPKAQTNSYLFRALSHTDLLETIWLIPPREMWSQYGAGKVTQNDIALWSIGQFIGNRNKLEENDPEDLPEERCKNILQELIAYKRAKRALDALIDKDKEEFIPPTWEDS